MTGKRALYRRKLCTRRALTGWYIQQENATLNVGCVTCQEDNEKQQIFLCRIILDSFWIGGVATP